MTCNLVQGGDGGAARLAQAPLHLAKLRLVLLALLVLPAAPGHRLRQRLPRCWRFHLSFTFSLVPEKKNRVLLNFVV